MNDPSANASLEDFMSQYTPELRELAERVLSKLRKLLPGAFQLVYDNYNALVVTFGASERPSDIVCSIALYPRWVTLFFLHGATLPDPDGLLVGSGKTIRGVVLASEATLDTRPLRALIKHAVAGAPRMLRAAEGDRLIIQSISPKRRPRRPASAKESSQAKDAPTRPPVEKSSRKKSSQKKTAV